MRQLILKDLYIQKPMAYLFPLFFLLIMFFNLVILGTEYFFIIAITFSAIWLSIYSNFGVTSSDTLQKRLMASLPVTRINVVQAKFVAALVWWGISFLFFTVIFVIIAIATPVSFHLPSGYMFLISISALYMAVSIFYPLYFIFSYQIAALSTIVLVMAAVFGIRFFASNLPDLEITVPIFTLLAIAISLFMASLSYLGTIKIFNNKDL
ncbi:ABC-2 transporter permease [Bacillus sp. FJAT-50079]|uniref:ABC-2 transporter permease n=1 Tax=Bacillus sp. FJAT-50079 TaxID=2833577 RepID=UPI001BC9329E|nr:ABC-2 transporter permease [Bacillus sp. FJAT-50079]MBS4209237.1 ABC-2 transporter permease [Bacillus sp. FJAT-50079]